SIGYVDGAVQNDPKIGNLGLGLASNRILVRPTLYGDVNLDRRTDAQDIGYIIGLGYYGSGAAPHGWLDGDLNGDGVVDGNDMGLIIGTGTYNNGSYGAKQLGKSAAGATLSGSDAVATTTIGSPGDGKMDYVYDPLTGDVKVLYD